MSKSLILAAVLIAAIPFALPAQRPGVPVGSNPLATSNGYTYGNILFPGGVPVAARGGHSGFGGTPHQQFGGGFGGGNGHGNGGGRSRTIVVPYAYPIFLGNDYGFGYDQQYAQQQQQQQPVTVVVQQQPNPPVIINQTFVPDNGYRPAEPQDATQAAPPDPSLRARPAQPPVPAQPPAPAAAPAPQNDDQATIFLIALTNGTVYSAIGYGVIDNTLTYTAPNGVSSRISMDQVDRQLSDRLNRERHVQFNLGTQ